MEFMYFMVGRSAYIWFRESSGVNQEMTSFA